jgi:hypothetical protein
MASRFYFLAERKDFPASLGLRRDKSGQLCIQQTMMSHPRPAATGGL